VKYFVIDREIGWTICR